MRILSDLLDQSRCQALLANPALLGLELRTPETGSNVKHLDDCVA